MHNLHKWTVFTLPGRSPTAWTDKSCWSAWTWTGRRSINRDCEFACGCGGTRPTACSATARCHTPMNWDTAGSTFIWTQTTLVKFCSSHGNEYKDYNLLWCDAMLAGNWLSQCTVPHQRRQYSSLITKYGKTIPTCQHLADRMVF
jgi:hypothetical protein